jgi:hypothetical protein
MGQSIVKLIALLLLIACFGLGIWGSYAIGAALGFYGTIGFACGAGIIAAGLIGVIVVGTGIYAAVKGVQSLCSKIGDWFRSRRAERAEQCRQQDQIQQNQNTAVINDRLYGSHQRNQTAAQQEYAELPPEYTRPPQYQQAPADARAPADNYNFQPKQYR